MKMVMNHIKLIIYYVFVIFSALLLKQTIIILLVYLARSAYILITYTEIELLPFVYNNLSTYLSLLYIKGKGRGVKYFFY